MAVAQAALGAGALSCDVLLPPDDQVDGWDAADAISEGIDVTEFIAIGPRMSIKPASATPTQEPTVWATDDALALSFTTRYAEDWRYCAAWGKWLVWDGRRWHCDETLLIYHLTRALCREAALKADSHRLAAKLASSGTVSGVERLVRCDRNHAATSNEWDTDLWKLNTPTGVVDLRTGHQHSHKRIDRMTKMTSASAKGQCPQWCQFLNEVTGNDTALQAYLQRMTGYCLTGVTDEHALFFLYGTGANGKSVFVNTLATILGSYAANAPMDTFMETRSDRHPTDLAGLRGARMVSSVETEQGRRWAESKLKHLTGGDKICARFMHQDFFEFIPQFKLIIAGNHKPSIRNIDEAMRRRLHLIPFTITVPPKRRDTQLQHKLLAEKDGILAWAIQGCLNWQRIGTLEPPQQVQEATNEYFECEDALGRWIDERCIRDANGKSLTAELFGDWKRWAEATGEFPGSQKRFAEQLLSRNIEKWRNSSGLRGFRGLTLKQPPAAPPPPYSDL